MMSEVRSYMVRLALLLILLLPLAGCKQRSSAPKVQSTAALEAALARVKGDAARSLGMAEAIKCRRLRQRLMAAGAVPRRLAPLDSVPLPAIKQGEAVLSMFQSGGRLRLFWATAGGVRELSSLRIEDLEPRLMSARDELEYGDLKGENLWGHLEYLHRAFLGHTKGLGKEVTRLLVLPDGMARYVPLHALFARRSAAGSPEFLASQVTVSYAPCLALAPRQGKVAGSAIVIVPAYGKPPRPLEGGNREAEQIASLLPGTRVLAGQAAIPSAFEEAVSKGSVVHFAGHGLAALKPGSPPELIFGGGRRAVTVSSAGKLKVRAPLVVLSSCTTAYAARFRDGKRLTARVNMAEALLAAGAIQVLAASWTAKDHWTSQQMKVFYSLLHARGPAAAMAMAYRHGIRRLVPPNPRFWAPHALYGAW